MHVPLPLLPEKSMSNENKINSNDHQQHSLVFMANLMMTSMMWERRGGVTTVVRDQPGWEKVKLNTYERKTKYFSQTNKTGLDFLTSTPDSVCRNSCLALICVRPIVWPPHQGRLV